VNYIESPKKIPPIGNIIRAVTNPSAKGCPSKKSIINLNKDDILHIP
jgi:hypothetical protein